VPSKRASCNNNISAHDSHTTTPNGKGNHFTRNAIFVAFEALLYCDRSILCVYSIYIARSLHWLVHSDEETNYCMASSIAAIFLPRRGTAALQQLLQQQIPLLARRRKQTVPRISNNSNNIGMSWFWPCGGAVPQQVLEKVDALRAAEAKLLALAKNFKDDGDYPSASPSTTCYHDFDVRVHDTKIPQSAVSLKRHGCHIGSDRVVETGSDGSDDASEEAAVQRYYNIHGVEIESKKAARDNDGNERSSPPLVLLHGYMNASSYFYRNFAGLSQHFPKIYSLDLLGYGLSSRPALFDDENPTVEQTEEVFCQSLEAWRIENNIDKMILAGHSMGGYLSVAYAERYPENVEQLVLISPAGVPDKPPPAWEERRKNQSFSTRMVFKLFRTMFDSQVITPGTVLRTLPEYKSTSMVESYVTKRLPAIMEPEERKALADYLYYNAVLPGSAEYCVGRLLTSPFLIAKQPLLHRIPALKVSRVSFLYGSHDWMDFTGGLNCQLLSEELRRQGVASPSVGVWRVDQAGHLLHVDNYRAFNSGVALATGRDVTEWTGSGVSIPVKLCPHEDMPKFDGVENQPERLASATTAAS